MNINVKEISDQICQIIADTFEVNIDTINYETSIHNHDKWESLNHINLILNIEEYFNINFDDTDIVELTSLEAIAENVCAKVNQGQS